MDEKAQRCVSLYDATKMLWECLDVVDVIIRENRRKIRRGVGLMGMMMFGTEGIS